MKPTKKMAKFLIYSNDVNEIYYELGKRELFVNKIKMLTELSDKKNPFAVMVITDKEKNLTKFIQDTDLRAIRLFKTCIYKKKFKKPPTKFVYTTCRNLVGLLHGKTVRVESNDKDLQDMFYKVMVEINDEFNFGCKFDFDKYDVAFVIKTIKMKKRVFLTTYFYGYKYPNVKLSYKPFDWNLFYGQWLRWDGQRVRIM